MKLSYGDSAYWNVHYENELTETLGFHLFDWYCKFEFVFPLINRVYDTMSFSQKVLVIGVGRSSVVEFLYAKGFRDITCIDISPVIIQEMQKKYSSYAGVEFLVLDVRKMIKFPDDNFTWIIDKGTIDSLFCSADFKESTLLALKEIFRVMKQECVFACISHAEPHTRVPFFRRTRFALDYWKVDKKYGEGIVLYMLTKTANEVMIEKRITGDKMVLMVKAENLESEGASTTAAGGPREKNAGKISVTSNIDKVAELVDESAEKDS